LVGGHNLRRRDCPGVSVAGDRRRRAQQTRATPKRFLSTHIGDLSAQRLRVTSPRGLSRLIVADPGQRIHRNVLQALAWRQSLIAEDGKTPTLEQAADLLFGLMVVGDDRAIEQTWAMGRQVYLRPGSN